jgi:hypothetical protein
MDMSSFDSSKYNGWHQFLRGYVSSKWQAAQLEYDISMGNQKNSHWERIFIKAILQLHMEIWQDQNRQVIGLHDEVRHRKETEKVHNMVRVLYSNKPTLNIYINGCIAFNIN